MSYTGIRFMRSNATAKDEHELHIDPTYAPLPEDEQIDRIVWQHPPALIDRVPLPVLEVAVCLVILFLTVGVIAALGNS